MICASSSCSVGFIPTFYNQEYCSPKCQNVSRVRAWRERNRKQCPGCQTLILPESENCNKCRARGQMNDWSNVTIAQIQGLRSYQISSRIRELARQAYMRTGRPRQCAECGYDLHFEVCHITAIKDFSPDTLISTINDTSNLLALCPNHHWELDRGLLRIRRVA